MDYLPAILTILIVVFGMFAFALKVDSVEAAQRKKTVHRKEEEARAERAMRKAEIDLAECEREARIEEMAEAIRRARGAV